jgi:SAM-dependent methyltransferase
MPDAVRAQSFGSVSDDYERYRPGPPAEALDWLLPDNARAVLDIGAGTGALTRLLVERVAAVTAVEPDDRMRRVLAERVPAATSLAGTAERLPVPDGSQDAVFASSAWHWVNPELAVPEAARVLRSGGVLGVLWSNVDFSAPAVRELWGRMRPDRPDPALARNRLRLVLPDGAPFGAVEGPHAIRFTRRFTRDDLIGLTGTFSAVITLEPPARERLLARVRETLQRDPRFADPAGAELPMRAGCWRTRRR